jgi:hypothetical protein
MREVSRFVWDGFEENMAEGFQDSGPNSEG